MKDPNIILNIENEIKKKYGEETIQNPKSNWDEQKEKQYLNNLKEISERERQTDNESEYISIHGVLMPLKLFKEENNRVCIACKAYSFNKVDDIYLNKFKTCFKCYVNLIEDREEKWLKKILPEKN